MEYKPLSKLYYSNRNEYEEIFRSRYQSPEAVHLDFEVSKQKCFFVQCDEVTRLMYEILRLDKSVALLSRSLPGKAITQYSRKCLIDEIVLTNNIEGVHSSRKEIGDALAILEDQSDRKGKKNRFLGMVNRYYKFMSNEKVSIETCQDIRNIYDEIVLEEVIQEDKNNAPDGIIFRKDQATVRSETDRELHAGITPEKSIIEHMEKALRFLHDENVEPLYRYCLFHYLFEYIHPFYDGNGRTGRFILSYCITGCLERLLAYRISETIKENMNAYYRAFKVCNDKKNKGDLTPFLIMTLKMIKESEEELEASLRQKLDDWGRCETVILEMTKAESEKEQRLYSVLVQAALFSELGIRRDELEKHLDISSVTLRKKLKAIDDRGLLETKKDGRYLFYMINTDRLNNDQ